MPLERTHGEGQGEGADAGPGASSAALGPREKRMSLSSRGPSSRGFVRVVTFRGEVFWKYGVSGGIPQPPARGPPSTSAHGYRHYRNPAQLYRLSGI